MAIITNYFLRNYSKELHSARPNRAWTPYNEAILQTTMLVAFAMTSLAATSIVLLMASSAELKGRMLEGRFAILCISAALILVSARFLTVRLCGKFKEDLNHVLQFNTSRDRRLAHIVFHATVIGSIALPLLVGLLLR